MIWTCCGRSCAVRPLSSSSATARVRASSQEDRIHVSFSNVKYGDIAPFVGLAASRRMNDIDTFELHRSRIPTALFKSVVEDINLMMTQYGPPGEHQTEEARSRFLSPVSTRQLFTRHSRSIFALRSSIVLSLCSTLLLGTCPNPFLRVASSTKAEWSITSRPLVLFHFFSSNLNSKPAIQRSAWTRLPK